MEVNRDASTSFARRFLTRPQHDDSSLHCIFFATGKNYGWEGYVTQKREVHSQVRETNGGTPLVHP
jgi:hypothetical protein